MNIPEDLQLMYTHFLDLSAKDIEHVSVSPETLMTLIERIGDLETDSLNLESYVHYECRKKYNKLKEKVDELNINLAKSKQEIVDVKMAT